jgi:hypothetical protein
VGILVICVLVFTMFCVVYTVFFVLFCLCIFIPICVVYISVGLLLRSDNSIVVNNNNNNRDSLWKCTEINPVLPISGQKFLR